nr:DUF5681 domain-containing protein [uncultured Halomonas sp.]
MSRFKPGQSGNPAGRPKGVKDARLKHRELFEQHSAELVAKAVGLALEGDTVALRICLDRIAPPLKAQPAPISVDLRGAEGLAGVSRRLVDEAAAGRVPADVASQLVSALGHVARIAEIDDMERRLSLLESQPR